MTGSLDRYVAEAECFDAQRRGDPEWLRRARKDGLERFQRLGFPTTRDEEWRFTSVAPIAESRFELPSDGVSSLASADLGPFEWRGRFAATLVFANGRYAAGVSDVGGLPAGVRVESLARALGGPAEPLEAHLARVGALDRRPFTALNTAFLGDGALIEVPASTIVPSPIHVLFVSVGEERAPMIHPRVLVIMGAGSRATIVESYGAVAAERYFTNGVTEIVVGENAALEIGRAHV